MELSTYINDLLYRYECVIIPGFGALLTHTSPAFIEDGHTFYPPKKTLSFNRQLQTNDGLLANYVATVEGCSYETALQKIRNYTGKISLELSEGKPISLKNIGNFNLNIERSIQFDPAQKQNFETASFGLAPFVSTTINRELYHQDATTLEEKIPLRITPEKRAQQPYLKYAAIALIALAVGGLGGMKLYEGEVKKHNIAERHKADSLLDSKIQQATFVIENPLPAINLIFKKQVGNYHIIAGAYREAENADTRMAQLRAKGYTPKLLGSNRYGLHQVIYDSYETRNEAIKNLYAIKNSENPDAWLLVQKID